MATWPKQIRAITLFVEDLAAAKAVLRRRLRPAVHFEDDASAVFDFGDTLINLLNTTEAPELIAPAVVAPPDAGSRMQFTISVDDVDAMCAELTGARRRAAQRPDGSAVGHPDRSFRDPAATWRSRDSWMAVDTRSAIRLGDDLDLVRPSSVSETRSTIE